MVDDSPANEGGMGLHYVNLGLLDTELDVTKPEALLYEPGPGGKLVLVAVEYAIPADLWTKDEPPVLFGQELKVNSFNLYALHVWAWKNNPSGLFASWNPRVSCEYWQGRSLRPCARYLTPRARKTAVVPRQLVPHPAGGVRRVQPVHIEQHRGAATREF